MNYMFSEVTEKVSWLSTLIENQDSVYCIGFSLVKNDHIFGAFSISAPVYRVDNDKIKTWIKEGREAQQKILQLF
ncbi:MAG: hypothetical protein ACRC1X_01960 [Lactobacillus panisapium]|uniref:hypothetical protein n=1 Tax=Lactobacillus panisapium TaxID=2012495 RepID=UPI0022E6FCC0|nr:hypothetical protein [Lactobacillus panisapium]